jgi:anti-anti-sigma regulatory factor
MNFDLTSTSTERAASKLKELKKGNEGMRNRMRTVSIRKLPDHLSGVQRREFYRDIEGCLNIERPAVVFDCSLVRTLDNSVIHLLLCCLEEAMKRNGDVRLAALRTDVLAALKSAEVDSLFQCFETIGDAVESFHRPRPDFLPQGRQNESNSQSEMNAA